MKRLLPILALLLLHGVACAHAGAVEVEFRLVVHDQPDVTVDKMDRERPITNMVTTEKGVEMQKVGLDLTCWARNVLVDGQPTFERYHAGKYVARLPIARRRLQPGTHTVWPGDHAFTLAKDGTLATEDPELAIDGTVVRVKCYPLTIRAYRANPDEAGLPMSMRVTPLPHLTVREAADHEANSQKTPPGKFRELLPVFDKFAPLTVWLPANTSGKGYVLHPVGLTCHLGQGGLVPGAGGGQAVEGLRTEGTTVEIPLYGFPIAGPVGGKVVVPGVEQFTWGSHDKGRRFLTNWYPRQQPYALAVADPGPVLTVDGDLRKLPHKSLRVDVPDAARRVPRLLVVEAERRHLAPGQKLTVRVRALDASAAFAARAIPQAARDEVAKAQEAAKAARTALAKAQKAKKDVEAAKAALTAADARLKAARAALEEKTAEMEQAAQANPIAGAPAFAQARPYGGDTWVDLQVAQGKDDTLDVALPDVPDGVYALRLGVKPPGAAVKPLATEQWVSIARPRPLGVGLFTQRGRDAFYCGEAFWIGVGIVAAGKPIPAGLDVSVDLVDERGTRVPLLRKKHAEPIEERETLVIRVDGQLSLALAPGRYRVEATAGSRAARPLALDLVDPTPRTHFANVLVGKYNVAGSYYQQILRTAKGGEELAREIVAMGYNTFIGMSYDVSRVATHGADIEQIVRERPELGPWESYRQPSGRDHFLNAAVRNNLRFYENLFTYNDTMLPQEPKILDACERYASLEMASIRHSPALQGVCLYDEFYTTADTGTAMSQMFYKAQEISYRAAHNGRTGAEAMKALDRFVGRPRGHRRYEDLATFRTWPAHEDRQWGAFTERMAGAAKAVMPSARNLTLHRFWGGNGGNIATNGTCDDVFAPLDIAACVMYKDGGYGDRPVFAPMQADVLRVRDDLPVWTQLHTFGAPPLCGDHVVRQAFFALSQKIEGLTFFTISHDYEHPSAIDNRDTVRDITGKLCTPYGDLFLACSKGYRRVAIYYSRTTDHLGLRKPNKLTCACEGLWVACMRAGFPADFIDDRRLLEGKAMDYDVVFAPGFAYEDEAPPEILGALKRLVAAGKTVAVERSSKLPIEGIVRLDCELDEYDDKLGGAFPRNIDFESEMVWDQSEETTKLVRGFLASRIPPAAQHDLLVGPDWLRCGQAEYMVIPNFAFTRFRGLYKTLYQAPDRPTLRFPKRPPACYDLLEMRRVDVKAESAPAQAGPGATAEWMRLRPDLRHYPGKIYAFLPSPIARVKLEAPAAVRAGSDLTYRVAVANEAGKAIDAGFPLQTTLRDAAGTAVHEVFRAAAPRYTGVCRVPVNVGAGSWTLSVRELVSGRVASAAVQVEKGEMPGATLEERPVWVRDAGHVRAMVAAAQPPQEAPEIQIAVDADQAWVRPQAERLAGELVRLGRKAKVVAVGDVLRLPVDWNYEPPTVDGARLWRGNVVDPGLFVDSPLILLGRRYESRLIEALARRDVLAESVSANFPGPRRAIVAWARRAFSNHHDTVSVLATDEAGLARGVDALLALAGSEAPHAPASPVHPTIVQPAPKPGTTLKTVAGSEARPSPYRDAVSREDLVRAVDVDQATGRALVATAGYGHNLFCFAPDGKLLWKQFLPEHNVYFAQWYDGGKRVVAATGRGFFVFLLDGSDGSALRKFASTEWPRFHGGFNTYQEGAINTEVAIRVNAKLRQILIGGMTGLLAVDFEGRRMWYRDRAEAIAAYPAEAVQTSGAAFARTVVVGDFALSPDGAKLVHGEYAICGSTRTAPDKIAPVWKYTPMILDARTGKLLAANDDDPGNQTRARGWWVTWPERGDPSSPDTAWIHAESVAIPLRPDGARGTPIAFDGRWLADGGCLVATPASAQRIAPDGRSLWDARFATLCVPGLDRLSPDESRLYRCDRDGLLLCVDAASGRTLWRHKLPFPAEVRPLADGALAGTQNGTVVRLDASGKPLWHTRLRDHHEKPDGDYPAYLRRALARDPDATADFFPVGSDAPGDYKDILRMGLEQLTNTGFEGTDGWEGAKAASPGHAGKKALALSPGTLVTQPLQRKVIPSATYLLEFFYRTDAADAALVAGALIAGAKETLTASTFSARPGQWAFGRLAVKTMADTTALEVGFEATGGTVHVDDVSFRPVRFPSANLLADPELHAAEPTFVRDLRVRYDRIPASLSDKLRSRNHVVGLKQGLVSSATRFLEEQAYLHNGRLDDVGARWFYQPDSAAFSVVLTRTAYVSHLVLYLNNATPENTYRQISIVANNLETKLPEAVALVRGNRRRFIVVHFPKLLHTDAIKVLPGLHRAHRECLTEIEVYGPLGGPEMAGAGRRFPDDADGVPMFMGSPHHVVGKLPPDLMGEYAELGRLRMGAPAYHVGATAVNGVFTYGEADGRIRSLAVREVDPKDKPTRPVDYGPSWSLATITPTTTPARYAARLLVGSADYKLHAIADNGMHLWSYPTGGRVYSSPVPDGDEVYFGSDDGRLYKVDVDSGILIWEFATGGKIRSAPALADGRVFAFSWDGFLYAVDMARGVLAWKAPVAKYTRSSPAVHGGRVYTGDEQGRMLCFDAKSGKPAWAHDLGGHISACPVVVPEGVCFASEQGDVALVAPDGAVRWRRSLGTRICGQPMATQTQLVVPTEQGAAVLRRADGAPDSRFKPPASPGKVIAALPYRGKLFLLAAYAESDSRFPPRTYVTYTGAPIVWAPAPKPEPKP